jgi:heme/copper-type cytochrome/quinol oxidase subunit 3
MDAPVSASAPHAPHIEAEPLEWQPRVMWAGARLLSGAVAFFFASFLFAYFYLRLLDTNHGWKLGHVVRPTGWGVAVVIVLVASAVALWMASRNPPRTVALGGAALGLALLSVILQVWEWTTIGFGAASGGYASVYVGWTSCYAVLTIPFLYWIETQVATVWREKRESTPHSSELITAGLESCAFLWAFYVAVGVIAFVVLFVV